MNFTHQYSQGRKNLYKSALWKVFVLLGAMVLLYSLLYGRWAIHGAIHEMPENKRDVFVREFLKSIGEDTDFYKGFIEEKEVSEVAKFRENIRAGSFKIVKWDGPFMDDECYVMLSDSSSINLYVRQRWQKVEKVHVYWHPKVVNSNS